jgi:hypothetical protein
MYDYLFFLLKINKILLPFNVHILHGMSGIYSYILAIDIIKFLAP